MLTNSFDPYDYCGAFSVIIQLRRLIVNSTNQDLVLYLTIKVRSAESPDSVPQPQQNTVTLQDSHGEEVTASTDSVSQDNTDVATTDYQHDGDANFSNPETQSQEIATTPLKIVKTKETTPNHRDKSMKSNNIDKKENRKVQGQKSETRDKLVTHKEANKQRDKFALTTEKVLGKPKPKTQTMKEQRRHVECVEVERSSVVPIRKISGKELLKAVYRRNNVENSNKSHNGQIVQPTLQKEPEQTPDTDTDEEEEEDSGDDLDLRLGAPRPRHCRVRRLRSADGRVGGAGSRRLWLPGRSTRTDSFNSQVQLYSLVYFSLHLLFNLLMSVLFCTPLLQCESGRYCRAEEPGDRRYGQYYYTSQRVTHTCNHGGAQKSVR